MNILYQFNEKYAPYAGTSITSLFLNNKSAENINVYILGEDLSDESCERFNKLALEYKRTIKFVDTKKLIEKMKILEMPTYRGSYAANMRLFISDILSDSDFEEDKRLLYLDSDTIVCSDLSDFYCQNIKTVAMALDVLGCSHKYDIGLSREDGYYNSGVILYDVSKWIQNDFTGKIIDHVQNVRAQYPSPDQDLLNVVLRNEITTLDFKYNFQPHLSVYAYKRFMKAYNPYPFYDEDEVIAAKVSPSILHTYRYIGEFPWHKNNVHPFNKEFDKYIELSPWKDYSKKSAEVGKVEKIEKLMYIMLPKVVFLYIFKLVHGSFYKRANKLSEKNIISAKM